jgi:hypothetical protein
MHDFKAGPGSKNNEREAMAKTNLPSEKPKPAESELEVTNVHAPADAHGCGKIQTPREYMAAVKG